MVERHYKYGAFYKLANDCWAVWHPGKTGIFLLRNILLTTIYCHCFALLSELVDDVDLKSAGIMPYGFDSHREYYIISKIYCIIL